MNLGFNKSVKSILKNICFFITQKPIELEQYDIRLA